MKITIYSSKGGAGKTPIAMNIVLDREYAVGTNDTENAFQSFIPDDKLLAIDLAESFPEIPDNIDIVFDLAMAISETSRSITSAILQSDLVIVPIENKYNYLNKGLETLREVSALDGFKGNIIVLATPINKGKREVFKSNEYHLSEDFKAIKKAIEARGFKIPILPLKFSKVFDTIIEKEMSIAQLRKADGLADYTYRDISKQFDALYKLIDMKEGETANAKQKQSSRSKAIRA